ncbi:MAG: hypothetical protein WCW40_12035 [Bacteroidota bacterium]
MTRKILAALLSVILFTAVDCKDEPTKPPVTEQPQDTTSHNFVVTRVDTLGSLFSFANGVDIVNENNIWVAGIFTEKDTDGTILYNKNLAHWDGENWTLMSIPMYGYNNTGPSPEELGAVKVFDDSLIFVVARQDNSVAWWNGTKWTSNYVNEAVVSPNFWARSPSDIYFVASQGRATHYNGQTFTKINTGIINPPLTDVWGDENAVYAVGEGHGGDEGLESVFLFGNSTQLNIFNKYVLNSSNENSPNFLGGMKSVFRASKNSKLWILGGWGSWKVYDIESMSPFNAERSFEFPFDYPAILIRGTDDNDLYVPSSLNSEFYHYNGNSWYKFNANINNLLTLQFAVKKSNWMMIGSLRNGVGSGIVVIGKHN